MKLVSWNVNGIRAVAKKGFEAFLLEQKPDIRKPKYTTTTCQPQLLKSAPQKAIADTGMALSEKATAAPPR